MTEAGRLKRMVRSRLLPWFEEHQRKLPWRTRRTPYRVWVSELMLQQTRVDQALPYYRRWMKRYPTLKKLAEASRQDVLKSWEGLGYYARARRLHDTAQMLVRDRGGRFPQTYEGLLELPGIGPYTAAAIASLAFDEDVPLMDGNVIRVLSRLAEYREDVSTQKARRDLFALAGELMPRGRGGIFNESLMELGATVCLPRKPACASCPLKSGCKAFASGTQDKFPVKRPKKKIPLKQVGCAVTRRRDGKILIAQRRSESMLGGLWEFPGGSLEEGETMPECIQRELVEEMALHVKVGRFITAIKHTYSHFSIELHAYKASPEKGRIRCIECADYAWVRPEQLKEYPFGKADLKVIDVMKQAGMV